MEEKNIETPQVNEEEIKKPKKKGGAGKVILTGIGLVVIALAVFVVTIKIVQPDTKLSQLVPAPIMSFYDEKILGNTTTTTTTTAPSTTVTTTEATTAKSNQEIEAAYLPIEEFKFKSGAQGNHMGNILSGGKVATDASYVYHIVDGKGIYRFLPSTEEYARIYESKDVLSSLNLRGDYLYFINNGNSNFYRLQKGKSKPEQLAEGIKTAYVYDKRIYLITTDNSVKMMKTDKSDMKELYTSADDIELIGISLHNIFFSVTDAGKNVSYVTVDIKGENGEQYFRKPTSDDELVAPVLENGFLYYFEKQDDLSYNLCRQKYGSEKVATLVKNVTCLSPAIVDKNKLFYGELEEGRFKLMELNMNSKDVRTMLFVKGVSNENSLICQHGGEYDFIIGEKNADGDKAYAGSSMYTGSANIMKFKEGKWSY